jgi:gamma-glutamylcyclotransferase (GGCT)/AIG2-like uncharacterized protein YtfP
MSKHLVFIYGSLRRGAARPMSTKFPKSKFVAEAKVNGSLYDLGAFPGLILNESNALVSGEVYEIDDVTLKLLDEFEASDNYCRKQVAISLGDNTSSGWTYEPDPKFYSLNTLINSGDWIEYARSKGPSGRETAE